jgi:hypothetical protein
MAFYYLLEMHLVKEFRPHLRHHLLLRMKITQILLHVKILTFLTLLNHSNLRGLLILYDLLQLLLLLLILHPFSHRMVKTPCLYLQVSQ